MRNLERDISEQRITVKRELLIEKLKRNLEKHKRDYQESIDNYQATLIDKLSHAQTKALGDMKRRYDKICKKINALSHDEIPKQGRHCVLVEEISVEMPVPRSFAEEYQTAIEMFEWDTREELEITSAQFACFIQDKWDWKDDFVRTSNFYKSV